MPLQITKHCTPSPGSWSRGTGLRDPRCGSDLMAAVVRCLPGKSGQEQGFGFGGIAVKDPCAPPWHCANPSQAQLFLCLLVDRGADCTQTGVISEDKLPAIQHVRGAGVHAISEGSVSSDQVMIEEVSWGPVFNSLFTPTAVQVFILHPCQGCKGSSAITGVNRCLPSKSLPVSNQRSNSYLRDTGAQGGGMCLSYQAFTFRKIS